MHTCGEHGDGHIVEIGAGGAERICLRGKSTERGQTMSIANAGLTRRGFVAGSVAGISAAVFGVAQTHAWAAPMSADGDTSYTPGTYTASEPGKFGPVNVEVTFTEHAIESVTIGENEETAGITDTAFATIPAAIVEHQTLDVDMVTGATLTSHAILAAVSDCVEQAGGSPASLEGNWEKPAPTTEVTRLEGDVVIVGAGASGMVAAISAARFGAKKVILLEKSCNVGGNALVSGGYLEYVHAPDELREDMTPSYEAELESDMAQAAEYMPAEDLAKLQADYDAWKASGSAKTFDSIYLHALQYVMQGEGTWDEMLKCAENIDELDAWLEEEGFQFKDLCGIVGYSWPRWTSSKEGKCGQGYFSFYEQEIERNDYPIEIHLNVAASELISEGGAVVGVRARSTDGSEYEARGARGVILACGGFSGSPDMLRTYNTMWPFEEDEYIPTTNCYGHTGDGITMGLAVGATVDLMDVQMPFPMSDCKNATDETTVGDDVDCVIVNKEGKRFMNEVMDRYSMTEAIMAQTDQMMYMVTDADTCRVQGDVNRYGHSLKNLQDQGQLFVADTLEELAGKIGCDPEVLTDTIERYNDFARAGQDDEFGRSTFSENSPVVNPPFYASPRTWAMHITVGGLVADIHDGYKVLDKDGAPIEGLRAVGETIVGSCGIGVMGEGLAVAKALFA